MLAQDEASVVVAAEGAHPARRLVVLVLHARFQGREPLALDKAGQPDSRLRALAAAPGLDIQRHEIGAITHAAFLADDRAMPGREQHARRARGAPLAHTIRIALQQCPAQQRLVVSEA